MAHIRKIIGLGIVLLVFVGLYLFAPFSDIREFRLRNLEGNVTGHVKYVNSNLLIEEFLLPFSSNIYVVSEEYEQHLQKRGGKLLVASHSPFGATMPPQELEEILVAKGSASFGTFSLNVPQGSYYVCLSSELSDEKVVIDTCDAITVEKDIRYVVNPRYTTHGPEISYKRVY